MVRPRRALLALLTSAVLVLAACNPDPTGGARPPSSGPVFTSGIWPVARADVASSWREGCPVHWNDLSAVNVAYWGYDGKRHTGNLVVHDSVAADVVKVFRRMYDVRYQIRRIHPVDAYGGSDPKSMAANNTSAFNCRPVAGTSSWSEHAYGQAIDINPVQNPYV
ncbi:MAG TPA: M15 family metallopeptidase, partial [Iamia sp.]|nr:M15 family metallopeptidase [Iamia sp.]